MAPDDERERIRAVDQHLLDTSGVVVDDVVLRAWGGLQAQLTYEQLCDAIAASGGTVDHGDLWLVAQTVASGQPAGEATRPLAG